MRLARLFSLLAAILTAFTLLAPATAEPFRLPTVTDNAGALNDRQRADVQGRRQSCITATGTCGCGWCSSIVRTAGAAGWANSTLKIRPGSGRHPRGGHRTAVLRLSGVTHSGGR